MGKSRSKTRSVVRHSSNRRLRSDSSNFSGPRPVPYLDPYSSLNRSSRVSYEPSVAVRRSRTVIYDNPGIPRSTPTRVPRVGDVFRQGVWHQAGEPVRATPQQDIRPTDMVCVRRQQRREVLHATKKTGRGGQKSPIYNRFSKINCKG